MSEISVWHDATGDLDDAVTGPVNRELHAEADNSIEAELEAALADAGSMEPDTFEQPPTEPVLLLADHSGEAGPDTDDTGHDELEHGIASVIASLYADARDASSDQPAVDDSAEEDDPIDDAVTYRLLGELDRLWHRAA